MKPKALVIYFSLLLFCFSFINSAQAAYGPRAYITEYVSQDYWWNGTAKSTDIRRGQGEVSVPNNWDVLQYVRVNTTKTNTNIQDAFFDNVVTSYSTTDSKDPIYANISGTGQSTYYNITNVSASPTINLSLTYVNYFGGSDIYDSDNIGTGGTTNTLRFNFSIRNPSSNVAINGVTVVLQFYQDTSGSRDVVNISAGTNTTTGSGTTASYMSDPQAEGDYDRYTWTGNLAASGLVYIVFNATLLEGAGGNIPDGTSSNNQNLDSNDKGGLGNYSSSATLSGIAINYKLARGSIRQGVDLQSSSGVWYARGLIRNMANASLTSGQPLTYNITAWRIYEVNPSTGAPYSNANMSGTFNPTTLTPSDGVIYTNDLSRSSNTSWYNTTLTSSKPYIASYFDWHVLWNDTGADNYASYINTTMDMQTVYKVDMLNIHALTGAIYPLTGNQPVTVNDTAYYWGSSSTGVGNFTIYSIIPANTTGGLYHGRFEINLSSVKVYFYNNSGGCQAGCQLGVGNYSNVSTNPTPNGANGSIYISVADLSSVYIQGSANRIGKNLTLSAEDRIVLVYDVLSNVSMTTGDTYVFTGNTTFNTTSGTQEAETHTFSQKTIQVSAKMLTGYKDLWVPNPASPTLVNASLFVGVQAEAGQYIQGIKFVDYVLNGTFNNNATAYGLNLSVQFCSGSCSAWTYLTHFNVSFNGTRQLNDSTWVEVFEFYNTTGVSGGFNLSANQNITVGYQMNIGTSGSYILPLQIAAFDPSTGESFSAESWGVIRVDVPEPALPLQITDNQLQLAKRVAVGTPAVWVKSFEVYNPNARPISSSFSTMVFGDAMDGFVSYYNDRGEKIEENVVFGNVESGGGKSMSWSSALGPLETRTYEVRVLTPPVVEIDRDIEVLDKLDNKMVKLKMDIFLKSFAEEGYSNLVLNLPIDYSNIIEVKDGFGRQMQFSGGRDSSSIIIDEMEPEGLKTISVIYRASYPTIIITPDRDRYDLAAPVSLEILVINGGETIEYPYMEVEIYTPGMDVIYSNIERLKTMEPLEKTQNYEKFVIPANAPGGMYVASARFREDFTVLASATGNFFVMGQGTAVPEALEIVLVLSVTIVLAYFSLRRLREVRRTKALMDSSVRLEGKKL